MRFRIPVLTGLALSLAGSTIGAEFYLSGAGGPAFYGSNSPADYYESAKAGAKTISTSGDSAAFDLGGGLWITESLGLELDWEFGPSANMAATYPGVTISENIGLGAFLLAPQYRLNIGSYSMAWVIAAPFGWEYVSGNSAITGSGAYTYSIGAGKFIYGGMTRIEYNFSSGAYGFLSGGYMAADIPNFKYTSTSSAGGSNQSLTDALNKNTGANASGGRVQIGIGYRFGRGEAKKEVSKDASSVAPAASFPMEKLSPTPDIFYRAEQSFDSKKYGEAAELYGQVPISFSRVAEARTKRGLALWWAHDYAAAERALIEASGDPGEWGQKAKNYLAKLHEGMRR